MDHPSHAPQILDVLRRIAVQPLARLAFCLLEPRSNDGLLPWNVLGEALKNAKTYPILRSRN